MYLVERVCLLDSFTCFPVVGDGRLGCPDRAPYDAIHVGAAAAVVPEAVSEISEQYNPYLPQAVVLQTRPYRKVGHRFLYGGSGLRKYIVCLVLQT